MKKKHIIRNRYIFLVDILLILLSYSCATIFMFNIEYNIHNSDNKIILGKDGSVSREKHALIIYEPKKRNFYLQPGDSSGLTYINDDMITETRMLNKRDIIELGNGKYIFIPLCNETFSWEDYLNKE